MEKERCLRLAVNANAKVWMDIWKHIRNKGNLLLEGSLNHACTIAKSISFRLLRAAWKIWDSFRT